MTVLVKIQEDLPYFAWKNDSLARSHLGIMLRYRSGFQPKDDSSLIKKPRYRAYYGLMPQVKKWLVEHDASWQLVFREKRGDKPASWFISLEPRIALLFKLTWGGL